VRIHVDADGCPVRSEVYRVAARYGVHVHVVANGWVDAPASDSIERVVVERGADAADDWIVDHAATGDVVVTADVPLAARCLAKGAVVLHPTGRPFTEDGIGGALAMRDLLARLRESGARTSGPAPFEARDRSQFLQALDAALRRTNPAKA
jgi:uncharacterized protein YaiI (UPF0178 family)